jgi:hypothetical protein
MSIRADENAFFFWNSRSRSVDVIRFTTSAGSSLRTLCTYVSFDVGSSSGFFHCDAAARSGDARFFCIDAGPRRATLLSSLFLAAQCRRARISNGPTQGRKFATLKFKIKGKEN